MKPFIDLTRAKFIKAVKSLKRPEIFFVSFASVFGIALVFITPPMQVPDEQSHFYQAYAVSNFDFVWDRFEHDSRVGYGAKLPLSLVSFTEETRLPVAGNPLEKVRPDSYRHYINQQLNPERTGYMTNGTSYSPIVYAPQAVGIGIGRIFNASPIIIMWLGRLANLLMWLIMIFTAIKIVPAGKWVVAILALNPMSVFISSSLSADVVITGLAFVFVSLVLRQVFSPREKISYKEGVILSVTLVALSLTKPVNILFGMLLFVIPWTKFVSLRKYLIYVSLSLAAGFMAFIVWNSLTYEGTQALAQIQRPGMGINPQHQLIGIVQEPIKFVSNVVKNYVLVQPGYSGDAVLSSFFGYFGWLDVVLPTWATLLYICGLFLIFLHQDESNFRINISRRLLFTAAIIALSFANVFAMYLMYTPVGAAHISGVQGRYFIPASAAIVGTLFVSRPLLQISKSQKVFLMGAIIFMVLSISVIKIILRYYVV